MERQNIGGLDVPKTDVPSPERSRRMEQAKVVALEVLRPANPTASTSPLGAGWSSDLDVYVSDQRLATELASGAEWVDLSAILHHLGYPNECSFAITDDATILAKADINLGEAASEAQRSLARSRRLNPPDTRSVLEVRRLAEGGLDLTSVDRDLVARLAAAEAKLGGTTLMAFRTVGSPPEQTTASRYPRPRRPQVRLAISGVDGSGKSTLTGSLEASLERLGIPTTMIWTRPGMRLERLDRLARWVRKVRKEDTTGLRRLAEGASSETISSRKGLVGWVWLMLVSLAYLFDIQGQTRKAEGVVIFDRHLLDALGTIDAIYAGVPSGVQRRIIRWFVPKADFTVWLDIAPDVAAARKPDDLIGADLVAKQASAYRKYASLIPRLYRHDGSDDSYLSAAEVLAELNRTLSTKRTGWRAAVFTKVRNR